MMRYSFSSASGTFLGFFFWSFLLEHISDTRRTFALQWEQSEIPGEEFSPISAITKHEVIAWGHVLGTNSSCS